MTKKNISKMRNMFLIMAGISTVFISTILLNDASNWYELVISVSSIIVTAVLGITTYYQTAEQNRIDMMDKIPYLRLVYEEFDVKGLLNNEKKDMGLKPEVILFNNKKFINITGCNGKWILPLKVVNAGTVTIKNLKHYFCEGDYRENGNKWSRLSDSGRAIIANQDLKNERMDKLNSFTYENADLKPEEHCAMEIIVTDPIANDNDNLSTYSFAFEMESIYGYTYTQYFVITTYFAGFDGVVRLQIEKQDIDVRQGKLNEN